MSQMNDVYTIEFDKLVSTVKERKQNEKSGLQKSLRAIFDSVAKTNPNESIIAYGEQADPPIVKNTGKAVLAKLLENRLNKDNIQAKAVHVVLYDDVFGSNSEVFQKLISKSHIDRLSSQTYAFAPALEEQKGRTPSKCYVESLYCALEASKSQNLPFLFEELKHSAKGESIGCFNLRVRRMLEADILPFSVKQVSFSDIEPKVIANPDLLSPLLEYSSLTGVQGSGVNLTLKTESGYRRLFVKVESGQAELVNPKSREVLQKGTLNEVLSRPDAVRASLNAASRVVMMYLVTQDGIHVTGGESSYNEAVSVAYHNKGNPKPLLTYIANEKFRANGKEFLSKMLGKRQQVEKTVNAVAISTGDESFAELV